MKILALDLSLNGSGMAVIELDGDRVRILEAELVDNSKIDVESFKLNRIYTRLSRLLVLHKVDVVVRERGFSKYPATTQKLFKVVGVCDLTCCWEGHDKVIEITPTTIKKALTGSGKGSKGAVQQSVRDYLVDEQYDFKFKSEDVSDATAVGIAYLINKGDLICQLTK